MQSHYLGASMKGWGKCKMGAQSFSKRPISAAVHAAIYSLMLATTVQAAPAGGQVVGGTGNISQSGLQTTINQTSQNMAINWQSYNVNSNERVLQSMGMY